jgi:acetyl esterase/lipase
MSKDLRRLGGAALLAVAVLAAGLVFMMRGRDGKPHVAADGTVHVPAFALPFSNIASVEAKAWFVYQATHPAPAGSMGGADIKAIRKAMDDAVFLPLAAKQNARYAVNKESRIIAGIYTDVYTPKDGVDEKSKKRVLINIHGGAFRLGARTAGEVESVPIASIGKIKVVSVDYRMAPEAKFPAASEDVAAVYKELLKEHAPEDIGIYGCSAGGFLTGEMIAWFQKEGLPNPGAIGIFCASTGRFAIGDTARVTPMLGGMLWPPQPGDNWGLIGAYFGDTDPSNPLAVPEASPELLTKFPPTLFVTGTRSLELSGAVHSHIALLKAGVDAQIAIWDGMDHFFFGNPDLPESREAYDVIVKFFDSRLGRVKAPL